MLLGQVIDDFAKRWKLQRSYLWEFILPDIVGIDGTKVSEYCQDVKFGDYNIANLSEIRYGAFKSKYAGFFEVDEIVATFLKPSPDLVSTYLYRWRNLIVDSAGFFYPKSFYARNAYIYFYGTDGKQTAKFILNGVFPKNVPRYSLAYGVEDVVRYDVTFNVDRVHVGMIEQW